MKLVSQEDTPGSRVTMRDSSTSRIDSKPFAPPRLPPTIDTGAPAGMSRSLPFALAGNSASLVRFAPPTLADVFERFTTLIEHLGFGNGAGTRVTPIEAGSDTGCAARTVREMPNLRSSHDDWQRRVNAGVAAGLFDCTVNAFKPEGGAAEWAAALVKATERVSP